MIDYVSANFGIDASENTLVELQANNIFDQFAELPISFSDTASLITCLEKAQELLAPIPPGLERMKANDIWPVQGAIVAHEWITQNIIPKYIGWLETAKRLREGNEILDSAQFLPTFHKEATYPEDLIEFSCYIERALNKVKRLRAVLQDDVSVHGDHS